MVSCFSNQLSAFPFLVWLRLKKERGLDFFNQIKTRRKSCHYMFFFPYKQKRNNRVRMKFSSQSTSKSLSPLNLLLLLLLLFSHINNMRESAFHLETASLTPGPVRPTQYLPSQPIRRSLHLTLFWFFSINNATWPHIQICMFTLYATYINWPVYIQKERECVLKLKKKRRKRLNV